MKRLIHLLTLLFLFVFFRSSAQTNVLNDQRVDPVLKQVHTKQPGLMIYGRKDGRGGYVNMAVLDETTHKLRWFTCYGTAFDSAQLSEDEYRALTGGAIDAFTFYRNLSYERLFHIEHAELLYRLNGNAALQTAAHNSRVVFNSTPVKSAQSTLQKLIAMEGLMRSLVLQLQLFDCKSPGRLAKNNDDRSASQQNLAGLMLRKTDSTSYFNADPSSLVARIVLCRQAPDRMFVYDRQGMMIDSVPLKPGKYAALLKQKEDVFLLYRGWLELQWQEATGNRQQYISWLTKLDSSIYRPVSWATSRRQIRNELVRLLERQSSVNDKISRLIMPEDGYAEQLIADTYRNEVSEISYLPGLGFSYNISYTRGRKAYEMTDHRGNVMSVVSDRKKATDEDVNGIIEHYNADIVSAADYYPFGSLMPGRTFTAENKYRYGYNGKENDNEVKGDGNQQDYGMRIYDPRVAKFLSVDPITRKYPELTPYQFASNRPIDGIDLDGLEHLATGTSMYRMGVTGSKNKIAMLSTERFIVRMVKENSPHALLDKDGRLEMQQGGPIGTDGKDMTGPMIYKPGTYYNNGPEFEGVNGDDPGDDIGEFRRNDFSELGVVPKKGMARVASGLEALESISDLVGIFKNQANVKIWNGLAKEAEHRDAFYKSTNLVNEYIKNNLIKEKDLLSMNGKADLINFLTDGTLPTASSVEHQLNVFYSGYQMILQNGIPYRQGELTQTFDKLNEQYKKSGGKKNFDNIRNYKRKEP